jgi:hypothetical protein
MIGRGYEQGDQEIRKIGTSRRSRDQEEWFWGLVSVKSGFNRKIKDQK